MPTLTVDGVSGDFASDKRLVVAIQELGVKIGKRCGGNGRCTTCRVEIESGEPDAITRAEYDKLKEKELYGQARLSCQMTCRQDMTLHAVMTLESVEGWTDTGPDVDPEIQPEPEWLSKKELA